MYEKMIELILSSHFDKTLNTWTPCNTIRELFDNYNPREIMEFYQEYLTKLEKESKKLD